MSVASVRAAAIIHDIECAPPGQRRTLTHALIDGRATQIVDQGTRALRGLSVRSRTGGTTMLYQQQATGCGEQVTAWMDVCEALTQTGNDEVRTQAAMTYQRLAEYATTLVNALSALDLH